MSSKFTNTAGSLALGASGLWLITLAIFWYGEDVFNDGNTTVYLVWTVSILAAGVLTFVATLGLRQRHSTAGTLGTVGVVILGIGVLVGIVAWAIPGWMLLQGVGMLLVVLAIRSEGLVPRPASLAYGSGMLIGVATHVVLTLMKVGTPDRYGDFPVAWRSGITVGLIIVAAGLAGIGTWLRSETPGDTAAMPEQTSVL